MSGAPGENNIMLWNAVIFGPHETPFEDGTFKLTLEFSEEYPNKPPVVKFLSKVISYLHYITIVRLFRCSTQTYTLMEASVSTSYRSLNHVNMTKTPDVPSQNRWSPTYDVSAILTSIQSLLSDPNPNSPANSMAAQLFKVLRPPST